MSLYKVSFRSQSFRMARDFYDVVKTSMNGEEDLHLSHLLVEPLRSEFGRRCYTLALLRRGREENSPGSLLSTAQCSIVRRFPAVDERPSTSRRRQRPVAHPSVEDIFRRAEDLLKATRDDTSSGSTMNSLDATALGRSDLSENLQWCWACTGCGSVDRWKRTTPRAEGFEQHSYLSVDRYYFRRSCGAWAINMKNKHGSSVVRARHDKSGNVTESEGRWPLCVFRV